jgi:hypothetical protein
MGKSKDPRRTEPRPQPTTASKPRENTQAKRTRMVAIALIAALILGVAITALSSTLGTGNDPDAIPPVETIPTTGPLAVTVPGDLDGDDKISDEERDEVETTTTTAVDLTDDVVGPAIAKASTSMMVTPSGQEWWDLIASQTSYTRLWEMPAPEGVNWYALTWSKRLTSLKGKHDSSFYPAVHIAFPSSADASAWAANAGDTETGATMLLDFAYRENVVTIAPAGSDLHREPLPKRLGDVREKTLDSGYWSIDYGRQIENTLANSPAVWRPAFRKYWQNLGVDQMRWSAVSRDPGRWVGKVTGFDLKKVDLEDAIGYVNSTMSADGNAQASTIAQMMRVVKGDLNFGPEYMMPQEEPDDYDLIWSQKVGVHTFMVTGASTESPQVGYLEQWISGDVMTVVPRPAQAPSGTPIAPPPGIPVPEGETPSPTPTIPPEENPTPEGPFPKKGDQTEDPSPTDTGGQIPTESPE